MPDSLLRQSETGVDVVEAVARALMFTHRHHGWIIGSPNEDGKVPLWLEGKGEFADHNWLIGPDGTVEDAPCPS